MSRKERDRLTIMIGIKRQELTQVQAAGLMGLGYRQTKRVWRRYQAEGDAGLVHRLRGKPSARRKPPALKAQVLARCEEERYAGFGPTLMAEYLVQEGLKVDHETLRRWRLAAGQRTVRRRRQKHRQWRERQPCFGAMVQLDGSHHDWFEGRRGPCVLMVMVDDATNRLRARFSEQETTRASYEVLEGWARRHRLPRSLYVDRDSIYRCEGLPSVAEQRAGKAPQTQFGRAMEQLGVALILAHSPQAKGRVERMNGVLQDRLVKALRLASIRDLETANRFLEEEFLPAFNRKFNVPAASALDVHQAVPRHLEEVLSWEEARVVQRDWTVACEGQWYQLDRQHEAMSLAGRQVIVRTLRDGRVQLVYRCQKLKWRTLPGRPQRTKPRVIKAQAMVAAPSADHPWRRLGAAVGRKFWREVKAQGRATQEAARLGVRDCGRPSLRSASLRPAPPAGAKRAKDNKQPRGHSLVS
ncbi:MAG: ISNCY family transposase [Verrucomicrobia bacterium]|nr:ISNCY family transposase [Verrucomicrobiota bacterium]